MNDKNRLPLIVPLLVYNGTKKYDSPRNLWDLFIAPEQARKLMTEDYRLVDLQSISESQSFILCKLYFLIPVNPA
jgi:hypothetical protein